MANDHPTTPEENWKEIPGYPDYEVSDKGNVRSWKNLSPTTPGEKPRFIAQCISMHGYQKVRIFRNKISETVYIYKLVLLAFVGPCPPGMEACHNDGTRTNNSPSNLRWDTRKNNLNDRNRHGTNILGTRNGRAKLDDNKVKIIRELYRLGHSQLTIATLYEVSQVVISSVTLRKSWKHVL